jgi:hypothetical protein
VVAGCLCFAADVRERSPMLGRGRVQGLTIVVPAGGTYRNVSGGMGTLN